jgi:hypothetical protein
LGRASGAIASGTWIPLPLPAVVAPPRWRLARSLPEADARGGGEPENVAEIGRGCGARAAVLAPCPAGEAEAAVAIRANRRGSEAVVVGCGSTGKLRAGAWRGAELVR